MPDNLPYMPDDDPFGVLGLVPSASVGPDDVRAAFLRIAAATHPDRDDGGDPARYAAAAAAYTRLGTAFGRGEAYADARGVPSDTASSVSESLLARARRGRPFLLLLRFVLAGAVWFAVLLIAGWTPATLAIAVLLLTWSIRTARYDLALDAGLEALHHVEGFGYVGGDVCHRVEDVADYAVAVDHVGDPAG
jgi:hypothetical protein